MSGLEVRPTPAILVRVRVGSSVDVLHPANLLPFNSFSTEKFYVLYIGHKTERFHWSKIYFAEKLKILSFFEVYVNSSCRFHFPHHDESRATT